MVSADENTPVRASGQRGKAERPGKKTAKRSRKPVQQASQEPKAGQEPEQIQEAPEPVAAPVASMDHPAADAAPIAPSPIAPAVPAQASPVSLQTITNAYGDYTRQSIEQTSSFFEQLAGTRSLNKAFELQSEFARRAYETFVAESRKIRELHSEMTRQRLRSLEGLVTRMKPTRSR